MQSGEKIFFDKIVTAAFERRASDIHLIAGNLPILRIDNKLRPLLDEAVVSVDFLNQLIGFFLNDEQAAALSRDKEIVLGYDFKPGMRCRLTIFYQKAVASISLRLIPAEIKDLSSLGLPPIASDLAGAEKGLLICSGPFGSGKSTTIAAILEAINNKRAARILTLEKPIEHIFTGKKSVFEQREVGRDLLSLDRGLEFAEIEDEDVIMVSEIASGLALERVLTLAESSRLVLTQITADSAYKTLERLRNLFPENKKELLRLMLGDSLVGVINQRLVPKLGGGQVLAAEILVATPAVQSLIKDGYFNKINTVIQTARNEGMITLERSLAELVRAGEVLLEDGLKQASDPADLKVMLK